MVRRPRLYRPSPLLNCQPSTPKLSEQAKRQSRSNNRKRRRRTARCPLPQNTPSRVRWPRLVYLGVASLAIAFLLQVKAADQVKYAKRKMERASLIVGTPSCQLLQMVQQFVKKGDPVAKIYEVRTIKAQIMISEKEVSEVKVGQPIELKARLSD
jgi:hypothetical protein